MIPITTVAAYVSTAVGTQVTIACEADATFLNQDWDGYTLYGADGSILHVAHIRQSLCTAAQNADHKQDRSPSAFFTYGGQRADETTGGALMVILHEAAHVALQSGDESVVECAAVKNRWAFVKQFRFSALASSVLMVGMSWRDHILPAQYHAEAC